MPTTPPPPARKKSGCGCFGCGCAVLVVLALLLFGAIGAAGYYAYEGLSSMSSPTPANIPSFTATDDGFQTVQQKMAVFQQAVNSHQQASIHLTADDLNTLLVRSPQMTTNNIRGFITLDGNVARIRMAAPTDTAVKGLFKGRYFNLDSTFNVDFDATTKSVVITPQILQVGDKQLIGPNADDSAFAKSFVKAFIPSFNRSFNQGLRNNPGAVALLDQAQTITIENSELVIETK